MGQVSCGKFGLVVAAVDGSFQRVEGFPQCARSQWRGGHHVREAGAEQTRIRTGEEEGAAQTGLGDAVAVRRGRAGDEAVQAQAAELVAHHPGGHGAGSEAQQRRQDGAQLTIRKALGEETEEHQRAQHGLHTRVGKAERRNPLAGDHAGRGQRAEGVLTDRAVVGEPFELEQTASKSHGLLMVVSVRSARPSLWYCLMRDRL